MVLYIYLIAQEILIYCAKTSGCIQTSVAHFNTILAAGVLELLFEIPFIVKIYTRKADVNDSHSNS